MMTSDNLHTSVWSSTWDLNISICYCVGCVDRDLMDDIGFRIKEQFPSDYEIWEMVHDQITDDIEEIK